MGNSLRLFCVSVAFVFAACGTDGGDGNGGAGGEGGAAGMAGAGGEGGAAGMAGAGGQGGAAGMAGAGGEGGAAGMAGAGGEGGAAGMAGAGGEGGAAGMAGAGGMGGAGGEGGMGGSANPVVCEQFNPDPVQTGTQGLCEKVEFIAIDCELLANSAPLPLNASVQAVDIDGAGAGTDIAFAGVPIGVFINDAFVLPSDLVCGFIAAGFSSSGVANSIISNDLSNADVTSSVVASFLDDGTDSPNLVSPHGVVTFGFADACGDDCVADAGSSTGFSCLSDSAVECEPLTFTDTCPGAGTGPGIFAPFSANPPGTILVDPGTGDLTPQVPPVMLTPTASGSVDFTLDYATTAIELNDLVGSITTDACVGGACATDVCSAETFNGICDTDALCLSSGFCADDLTTACTTAADCTGTGVCFGTSGQTCTADADCPDITGPRIMYDATCSKPEFEAGTCTPFDIYADVADVCKGAAVDFVDAPPCCDIGTFPPVPDRPFDPNCNTNTANRRRCCASYQDRYPAATSAQQPQLWVNP